MGCNGGGGGVDGGLGEDEMVRVVRVVVVRVEEMVVVGERRRWG